jgi:hypothetical protein
VLNSYRIWSPTHIVCIYRARGGVEPERRLERQQFTKLG